ncbi:hypothetical protein [Helicobacter felis]|uniref:hypothetical protein n=1 Tax=Helicobacter felis TaxID=214 RepID=UPI00398A0424
MQGLPENSIDCVLIDPPYCSGGVKSLNARNASTNKKYCGDNAKYYEFVGDGKDQRVWITWIGFIFAQIERILKPNSYFFSFIDWRMLPALSDAVQLADLAWRGVIVVVLGVFFLGCTPRVVYKEVYIPTKCQIVRPARPSKDLEVLEYLRELLAYTEELEKDLEFCTKAP